MNPESHENGVSRQCDLRQDRNLVQISLHLTFPTPLAYDLSLQPCFFSFLLYFMFSVMWCFTKNVFMICLWDFCHKPPFLTNSC